MGVLWAWVTGSGPSPAWIARVAKPLPCVRSRIAVSLGRASRRAEALVAGLRAEEALVVGLRAEELRAVGSPRWAPSAGGPSSTPPRHRCSPRRGSPSG